MLYNATVRLVYSLKINVHVLENFFYEKKILFFLNVNNKSKGRNTCST